MMRTTLSPLRTNSIAPAASNASSPRFGMAGVISGPKLPSAAPPPAAAASFTGYQKFVVGVLAFLQFTIILDFMILSPLGAMLMPALAVT